MLTILPEKNVHMRLKILSIEILDKMYKRFDVAMAGFSPACKKKCADCCTCNVTATSLEAAYFFSRLDDIQKQAVLERLEKMPGDHRYRPGQTTNGFARACMTGAPMDEEDNDPAWGVCPLLEDGLCSVYRARPFGCRSMMSRTVCKKGGHAQMPELALTINTVFLQYIEHLDRDGVSGNFFDLVYGGPCFDLTLEKVQDSDKTKLFIRNQRIPALMVPPEHRDRVASIVKDLGALVRESG